MVLSQNNFTPIEIPDLNLTLPYADCLRYVQYRLKMFGRGDLKPFCESHSLPYTTVINLKNDKLRGEEARLVQRLLRHLSFATTLVRIPPSSKSQRFLFGSQQERDTFKQQLAGFASSPILPEDAETA